MDMTTTYLIGRHVSNSSEFPGIISTVVLFMERHANEAIKTQRTLSLDKRFLLQMLACISDMNKPGMKTI
jgi:hypothetical protein